VESIFPLPAFFPPSLALSRPRTPATPRPRSRFCRPPLNPSFASLLVFAASVTARHSSSSVWGLGGTTPSLTHSLTRTLTLLCASHLLIALFSLSHDCALSPSLSGPLFCFRCLGSVQAVRSLVLSFLLAGQQRRVEVRGHSVPVWGSFFEERRRVFECGGSFLIGLWSESVPEFLAAISSSRCYFCPLFLFPNFPTGGQVRSNRR
jgi:hypothetical protein